MCGIAGVFGHNNSRNLAQVVETMAASLIHRGPDDEGVWVDADANFALGHRRLSILDLSMEGHQPMLSRDGRFVMGFNGEVYNHHLIREELDRQEQIGWRGHSDTEVILAAISAWGLERALSKFVGMFAIVLFDRAERRLHLIRDRMGEKPLYYGWCNSAFIFGSELKALKKYPAFAGEVDRDVLALYLRHMVVPAPFTIYQGVYKLQPGYMLSLDFDKVSFDPKKTLTQNNLPENGIKLSQWWSLRETVESGKASQFADETEALELLETRLRESIRWQSIADVPLGTFLSGGVDSSLITALMQSESVSPVRTFTIGFQEKQYSEADHASTVARHLGTEHIELCVTAKDALGVVQRLPSLYDEPFADSSQLPTFLLCAQAREYMKVALSGDAGDELFGGYNRYFWVRKIWANISWLPHSTRRLFAKVIFLFPPTYWDKIYALISRIQPSSSRLSFAGQKLHNLAERLVNIKSDDELFYSLVSEWESPRNVVISACEPFTLFQKRNDWPELPDIEHRMMYLDAMTYLPDDIMVKVDRAAMGASLETRSPYMDHRIVELAWRMPLSMKIQNNQGKWPLRKILYKYVPRELIERPKQGFGVPLADWLRGPLRDWAENLISVERLKRDGYFFPEPIHSKWQEHLTGLKNWEHSLWPILMFQQWLDELGGV